MEIKQNIWNSFAGRCFVFLLICGVLATGSFYRAAASPMLQSASEGQDLFEQMCMTCHSIGGGILVGPDLKGVLDRRDRAWLTKFISAPDQMLEAGDPIATELLSEFNNVPMPNQGLDETEIESLLLFFEGGESVAQIIDDSLPAGNISRGEAIFSGGQALENGGTPCLACHTVGSVGSFGGGNLGPDLTHVVQRFGEAGLTSTIQKIAFPTMIEVYAGKPLTTQEVADLLAFFTIVDKQGEEGIASKVTPLFWAVGALGAGALFGGLALFWPRHRENLSDRLRRDAGIISRRHS